ncbi:MAG: transposase [Agriterribacter sp.]
MLTPTTASKAEQICKITGLGIQTLAVVVAETNGFAGFQSISQLVSYAGYDVVENQSGKRTGKTRISKKGNSHIRCALFFPAFNVVKYQVRPFVDLFQRVFERRKIKMKAYTAVQKKILEIIYVLWKKDQAFDPNYQDKPSGELELEPSFTSAPQEPHQQASGSKEIVSPKSKVVPDKTRTTQDKHPSKHRRMPSFT